jgi:hypothetical protein
MFSENSFAGLGGGETPAVPNFAVCFAIRPTHGILVDTFRDGASSAPAMLTSHTVESHFSGANAPSTPSSSRAGVFPCISVFHKSIPPAPPLTSW